MAFGSGFRSTERAKPCKKRGHRCKAVELHFFVFTFDLTRFVSCFDIEAEWVKLSLVSFIANKTDAKTQ
jgi:hypothetical protein